VSNASAVSAKIADIKKAFESEFEAKVRARLIAVDTPQKADQVRAQALADPNAFGELSKKNTVEPGVAAAYGVIPPIRRHLGDPSLEKVAFSLKPGQISEVVHVANMFYILKCEEIMPQQFLSSQQLAEQQARVKEKIKENKLRASASDFFEKKKKEAKDPEKDKEKKNDFTNGSGIQDRVGSTNLQRGKGTIFLIDRRTHTVIWSLYSPSKSTNASDVHRNAEAITKRLAVAVKEVRQ